MLNYNLFEKYILNVILKIRITFTESNVMRKTMPGLLEDLPVLAADILLKN